MKTREELLSLKEEYFAIRKKLSELTPDELRQVTGGETPATCPYGCINTETGFCTSVENGGFCRYIAARDGQSAHSHVGAIGSSPYYCTVYGSNVNFCAEVKVAGIKIVPLP